MKSLILTTLLLLACFCARTQCDKANYDKLIREGDQLAKNEKYINAVRKYMAATIICPDNNEKTQQKIVDLFNKIEALKIKAVESSERTQKIIDAFYFYDGKFALANKDGFYGFIDKNGRTKIEYKYTDAQPFNQLTGYAKVWKKKESLLIDTSGNEFPVTYDLNNISDDTFALDLSNNSLYNIPKMVFGLKNLKILNLANNNISVIPGEIGNLVNLIELNLSYNSIKSIPPTIGKLDKISRINMEINQLTELPAGFFNLKNLKSLDLSSNLLKELPIAIVNFQNLSKIKLADKQYTIISEDGTKEVKIFKGNQFQNLPESFINMKNVIWDRDIIQLCATNQLFDLVKIFRNKIIQQKEFDNTIEYGSLAWWSIIGHDFEGAILFGKKYMNNGGNDIGFISNLALGLLWNGNYENAKDTYVKYKDNIRDKDGKTGKEVFLKDISIIEAYGIIPKRQEDVDKIKKLLQE